MFKKKTNTTSAKLLAVQNRKQTFQMKKELNTIKRLRERGTEEIEKACSA